MMFMEEMEMQPKRPYTRPVLEVRLLEQVDIVTASRTVLKNYDLTASGSKSTAFDWSVWSSTDSE